MRITKINRNKIKRLKNKKNNKNILSPESKNLVNLKLLIFSILCIMINKTAKKEWKKYQMKIN